jgi:methyltransferase (TIGR00027 family)
VVAFFRACANEERNEQFRGPDYLARIFYPAQLLLKFSVITRPILEKLSPGLYEYVMARTRFFDRFFFQALENNIPQIVLLGAGYDTRACRFQDHIQETRIFELDAPATQRVKRRCFERANIAVPRQLSFIPISFNRDDLGPALFEAGFDKNQKTLFIWEGVTMYLTAETIDSILDFISRNSAAGSTVVFDYAYRSVVEGTGDYYGARPVVKAVTLLGEPYRFGIGQGKIESFLAARGFEIITHYTAHDLQTTFLTADDGSLFGQIADYCCNVHAAVKT